MSEAKLLPYLQARNLDQDAWFFYETTSTPYYEMCARLCREFAELFNRLLTGQELHGAARLDYWVSRYLSHAQNIRRGIELIRLGGDYLPIRGELEEASSDYRGLIEQPLDWMSDEQRKQWDHAFGRLSYACGTGSETLRNAYQDAGINWLNRASIPKDKMYMVDRDDGHVGDCGLAIQFAVEKQLVEPPQPYPPSVIDRGLSARAGGNCPKTGVWIPEQGLKEYSLAFCLEGRPMQPAFRIIGSRIHNPFEGYDDEIAATYASTAKGSPVTRAEDTTWYFVAKADELASAANQSAPLRGRCEGGETCPRSGYWLTPARPASRRHFAAGEIMPVVPSDYGSTIWQWDPVQ